MATKIGILGSGAVGRALGHGFLEHGHDVLLGTRDPAKLADWVQSTGGRGKVGSFAEAAAFGDIVVLATRGAATDGVMRAVGLEHFGGKTVIDATNPIDESQPPRDGVLRFYTAAGESQLQRLQTLAPQAHLVKAFSCVGAAFMVEPPFAEKPTMFICGDHQSAKDDVTAILTSFGWEVEDLGTSAAAGAIEALCILWCIPGFREYRWSHALRLVKA